MRAFAPGLLWLVTVPTLARADSGIESVSVRFEDTVECSDEQRFFAEVRARTPRVRLAAPEEPARIFRVRVARGTRGARGARGKDSFVGSISTVDGAAVSTPRTIEASTCDEAVVALAFIAALSVDPAAALPAEPARPQAPASPPSLSPASEPAVTPPPAAPAKASEPPDVSLPPPSPSEREPRATEHPRASPAAWSPPSPSHPAYFVAIGGGPTASGPDAPSAALGARAFVEIGKTEGLAPSARLSIDLPSERRVSPGTGVAAFTWIRGAADVCPIRLGLAADLAARPCGGVEVGTLEGAGSGIAAAKSSRQPWVAGVVEARLRYDFIRFFFAEVDAGVTVPFVRQMFVFLPSPTVYQAPPAFFRGFIAAGVRFP